MGDQPIPINVSPASVNRNQSKKKSIISNLRFNELKQPGAIYEITCGIADCPCGQPNNGCGRGFFSLFVQAMHGIAFASRLQLPYYVNFGNVEYAYTQPGLQDSNFWNYYFKQPLFDSDSQYRVTNDFIESYPLRIWSRSFVKSFSKRTVATLIYQDEVSVGLAQLKQKFAGKRVLGVHIRGTDHHDEILPVGIGAYLREVDKRLAEIDQVFLATDEAWIVTLFNRRYGNLVWVNDAARSSNGIALHVDKTIRDRRKLGLDALLDCYSLALCKEAILTQSNFSYAALLFNPALKYKLMERIPTKLRRLKTLAVYYLDKWNIRKW